MIHGFDLKDPLVCEGIVGDGCGGGRIFYIKDETLYAHDPITKEDVTLLENIKMPKEISKKACDIFIKCEDKDMVFNLSSMKLV